MGAQLLGGAVILPRNRIVPLKRSRIATMKGRSTVKEGGSDTTRISTEVAAAASVPSSLTSTYVFCFTLLM